ncbi:hypothetical protein [Nonomuraea rubra]|uniref:Uncharacterized protein n=1 Tax=Nonomuraea rubra TaxID=46180 RepID=A0A7X0P6C6_9ACTN|nr:hypothetical protein [Nonomuraea rubra]MBB6556118.1 hypothetical protein [Nonomuraea rubra]
MTRWRGPRGIEIEVIVLNGYQRFKVTQTVGKRRYLLGYYGNLAGVLHHVGDLADLVEVLDFPADRHAAS